ncbi:hypothetical protein EI555_014879 [Monodon monoceros]|uniref:Neuropeptide B n=1 Tax=Monodon monoceros TaxID=40151 RepID=A0A4U1FTP5_MONMO|nr:hypothetical protein EI555_014879 [Monodon monoceros]
MAGLAMLVAAALALCLLLAPPSLAWYKQAAGPAYYSAVCVEDVTRNLQSCERLPDGRAMFQCKADVFLSLRAADYRST